PGRTFEPGQPPGDLEAVEIGHVDVEQHDVGTELLREAQRAVPVLGFADDVEIIALEEATRTVAERLVVVDDQDGRHPRSHRSACGSANSTALERFSSSSASDASSSGSSTT